MLRQRPPSADTPNRLHRIPHGLYLLTLWMAAFGALAILAWLLYAGLLAAWHLGLIP